jgi:uncharacterized OsmC-like protein
MNSDELRALQAPLKDKYCDEPGSAMVTLRAEGKLGDGISCSIETGQALIAAGLHPATGGTGSEACSGDMLLQALAACAGVTLRAVATAFGAEIRDGTVKVEGDLDFRGTLGVAKDCPVGFKQIRLAFELDSDAAPEVLDKIVAVTERYCVVLQTIKQAPEVVVTRMAA